MSNEAHEKDETDTQAMLFAELILKIWRGIMGSCLISALIVIFAIATAYCAVR